MILCDTEGRIYKDVDSVATPGMEIALKQNGALVERLNENILYRFDVTGGLAIYDVSGPRIHSVRLTPTEMAWFAKQGHVVTRHACIRDVGFETTKIYMDDHTMSSRRSCC